jgi:hypothetical protein
MKTTIKITLGCILLFVLTSCLGEAKEKFNKAKDGVSNATTFVKEAQKAEEKIERLRKMKPLSNEQLKVWLPKKLNGMERTGFKVGQAGYAGMNSVEGTFKKGKGRQKFKVSLIDGAGPTGSMMATGYSMFGNMDMEVEDENKHQQTVTVDGIKTQQTYKKKANNTQLMFAYDERFLITIDATDMSVDETWQMTKKLDFKELVDLAK